MTGYFPQSCLSFRNDPENEWHPYDLKKEYVRQFEKLGNLSGLWKLCYRNINYEVSIKSIC